MSNFNSTTITKQAAVTEVISRFDELLYKLSVELDTVRGTLAELRLLRYSLNMYMNATDNGNDSTTPGYTDDAGLES